MASLLNSGTLGTMLLLDDDDRLISFRCNWRRSYTDSTSPLHCKMKYCIVGDISDYKWSSLPHQQYITTKLWQWCWLKSISSDFLHNEHVIASWFQLKKDTDLDSCMLKCLHLRIPHCYQMKRWLRQTWLVLWQIAAGHGWKLTCESICCAYQVEKSQDLMIWQFLLDKCC